MELKHSQKWFRVCASEPGHHLLHPLVQSIINKWTVAWRQSKQTKWTRFKSSYSHPILYCNPPLCNESMHFFLFLLFKFLIFNQIALWSFSSLCFCLENVWRLKELSNFVYFLTRVKERPKLVTTYKQITEMQYRCCPGYFGENCDMGRNISVFFN